MKFIDNLEIGSEAWLEFRKSGIGASESSAVLGLSKYKTRLQLWDEKVNGTKQKMNSAMQRGNDREAEARFWFELEYDVQLEPKMVQHETLPWKYATLDGISENGQTVVEIKWCNAGVHSEARQGKVAELYYPQVQSQLACTGLDFMYFLSCSEEFGVVDYQIVVVNRDNAFIENLIEQEKAFYALMVNKIPPEICDRDYERPKNMLTFNNSCEMYEVLSLEIKLMSEKRDAVKKDIMSASGNRNCSSTRYKATKSVLQGRIDYTAVKELEGVDLMPYRKASSESWRITGLENTH